MTLQSFNVQAASASLVTLLAADMAALNPTVSYPSSEGFTYGKHGAFAGGSSGARVAKLLMPKIQASYGTPRDWDVDPLGDSAADFAPASPGNIIFTQSYYDAVAADMRAIYRLASSLDSAMGTDVALNQRIRGSAYFSNNFQTLYWEDAPPWISLFTFVVSATTKYTATWTVDNASTPNYRLALYVKDNTLGWTVATDYAFTSANSGLVDMNPKIPLAGLLVMYNTSVTGAAITQQQLQHVWVSWV